MSDKMKTAYKLRFVPLAITLPTLIIVLVLRYAAQLPLGGTLRYCAIITFASFIFLQAMREQERNKNGKERTFAPKPQKYAGPGFDPFDIPISNIDDEACPVIRVLNDGSSYLLTEWFPLEGNGSHITEEMILRDMAAFISAQIFREDRDRFVIMSNAFGVITKALEWLDKNVRRFDKGDKMQVIRAYFNCGEYYGEAFRQYESKGLISSHDAPGSFPYEDFLHEEFPDEFLMWVDWREEDKNIIRYCENILQTGSLSAESYIDDSGKLIVIISYRGQEYSIPYMEDKTDRDTTIISLNEVLAPDYEIRFCIDSGGSDTLAFLPLSTKQWAELIAEFGLDKITDRFREIKRGITIFG